MKPGQGAPKVADPAACRVARSRPKFSAAWPLGVPLGSQGMTRALSSAPSTGGTGTAPASASQRRP